MKKLDKLFKTFHQEKFKSNTLENPNTLIVLDTNYLLSIFRLSPDIGQQYLNAIKQHKKRIYIPYFVALEFYFNKSIVKKSKEATFGNYYSKINELKNSFEFSILTKDSHEKILKLENDYKKEALNILKQEEKKNFDNNLYQEVLTILEERIGEKPSQEYIDNIQKNGKKRFEEQIPPGFDDSNKKGIRSYDNIRYDQKYGDLLIWKDMINEVSKQKKSSLIFVTDDGTSNKKNDLLFSSHGRTVGPNISLMDELNNKTGANLYILSNKKFVKDVTGQEFNDNEVSSDQSDPKASSITLDFKDYYLHNRSKLWSGLHNENDDLSTLTLDELREKRINLDIEERLLWADTEGLKNMENRKRLGDLGKESDKYMEEIKKRMEK